ncbi:MAG TPA: hypothetical protein VL371_12890 [Gemmataceae bacterium]|nr:hypothetical protein [Gemmataceae bacterium]
MSDNTQLSAAVGTGDVLQTDDLGTYKIAASKITLGANNSDDGYVCTANPMPVSDAGGSLTVDNAGTFAVQAAQSGTWNVTNISGTVSLPTGAATAAKQPALGTAGTASADVLTVQGIASMTALKVDGSAVTQPVSAASLPLPSGASTAAKQPALGTAGAASADVLTVQGIASMTALKVDGSGVTQPVSGTVTVQQSTASSLKVDLSGTAANATAIKVDGSAVTQPVSGTVTANAGSGTFAASDTGATSGGLTPYHLVCANSNNATSVKNSAGQLYHVSAFNNSGTIAYLKIYDKATAPAPASDTPKLSYLIPANTSGAGLTLNIDKGVAFASGIAIAVVTGIGDTDNTLVAASAYIVNLGYK